MDPAFLATVGLSERVLDLAIKEGPGFAAGLIVGAYVAWRGIRGAWARRVNEMSTSHAAELKRTNDQVERENTRLHEQNERLLDASLGSGGEE